MSKYFDCLEQATTEREVITCDDLLSQEDEFDDDEFDDDWDDEDEYEHDDDYDPMWDDDETWRQ